jgi:hypothetical protein
VVVVQIDHDKFSNSAFPAHPMMESLWSNKVVGSVTTSIGTRDPNGAPSRDVQGAMRPGREV